VALNRRDVLKIGGLAALAGDSDLVLELPSPTSAHRLPDPRTTRSALGPVLSNLPATASSQPRHTTGNFLAR